MHTACCILHIHISEKHCACCQLQQMSKDEKKVINNTNSALFYDYCEYAYPCDLGDNWIV